MKASHKGLAGNILFALNIFILFLLVFESRIIVPVWLHPLGRMHPMLLHFPIVILMLAMLLEFFRFRAAYKTQEFYQSFNFNLLITGLFSSAITVIMGLLLSREDGYAGNALQWHKWSGVSIVFITSIIYWSRDSAWYKAPVAKAGALLTFLCLILAGHYGAVLTHGDNFILAPVASPPPVVTIEEAVVFGDVIHPILQKKCISCHNPDKIKGNLILSDEKSIVKGGKSGKLFVAGNPEISLLLERIHLPLEEKKHMPPSGKTQLTDDETILLHLWVKNNADFKQKVTELPERDSLRALASSFLNQTQQASEKYDFAAVDEETVKKLNNNYRVISPLAKGSPALSVNIFNKASYTPKVLEELSQIKKQIISLNLDNIPVKDGDMSVISTFVNLRALNLNFTDISGVAIAKLSGLKNLRSLALAGTKMSYADLRRIHDFKALKKVTVWETGLKDAEIAQLQRANKNVEIISGFKNDGTPIKLNLPTLKNKATVFSDQLALELEHPIKGVDLRYTTDGTRPDSIKSPRIKAGTYIKETILVKVKAFKTGWLSSNVAAFNFYKSRFNPDSISFLTQPDYRFKADGPRSLVNGLSDNYPLKSSDEWVGFVETDLNALLHFKQPRTLSSVALNVMIDVKGEIHPPSSVQIWGGTDKTHLRLLKAVNPAGLTLKDTVNKGQKISTIACRFKPTSINYLKIIAVRQSHSLKEAIEKSKPAENTIKRRKIIAKNTGNPKTGKKKSAAKNVNKQQVKNVAVVPPAKPKKPQPVSLFVNEILIN